MSTARAAVLTVLGTGTALMLWTGASTTSRGAYTTGLIMNLWNPKAGVFAISVIPQFVHQTGPTFTASLILGALWAGITFGWYAAIFIPAVSRGRQLMTKPAVQRRMRIASGVTLLALGAGVALGT